MRRHEFPEADAIAPVDTVIAPARSGGSTGPARAGWGGLTAHDIWDIDV